MLLLQIFTEFAFNKVEALTELNFADVNSILSTRRFVFLPLGTIKSRVCHFIQYIIIKFFLILQGFPCFFNTHMI